MEPIYITGHKNPDTDSIVAAIAYASLKHSLGERHYVAARIGDITDQTQHMLARFGFEPPLLIKNVRTQVCDLDYDRPPVLGSEVTIHRAWETMRPGEGRGHSSLPVADEDGRLFGLLTAGDIADFDLRFVDQSRLSDVPLFNVLSCLDGQLLTADSAVTELSGELVLALSRQDDSLRQWQKGGIVLTGDHPDTIAEAVKSGASCIIACAAQLDPALVAACGSVCVIYTPYDAYRAARLLIQSVPVSRICTTKNIQSFHLTDYLDDVKELILKSRYRSYPILGADDRVVGTLSRYHLLRPNRKRIVLVDHNELTQSVVGLEQAEIMEIIDHHRLADVQTVSPVYVRNEPVGSTCTIIASMFQEHGIVPGAKLAGLIAAGIVADTVLFKSPTCTARDRVMAERMAKIASLSLDDLGRDLFSTAVTGEHDLAALLLSDFKQFQIAGHALGIGQLTCINSEEIAAKKVEIIALMEKERQARKLEMLLMMLTDVLREGTELLVTGDHEIVEHAFNIRIEDDAVFLPGVMSRKKQVVPALSVLWG